MKMIVLFRYTLVLLFCVTGFIGISADALDVDSMCQRVLRQPLSEHWEFIRTDMANAWEVFRPVVANKPESVPLWCKVAVPHCYNAYDAVDPDVNYYQGAAWYRTLTSISNPFPDGRIMLEFEGAGQKTDVYVYTTKVGSHVGGYDRWSVDITDAVKMFRQTDVCSGRYGELVPIAVRCDNGRDTEMIPSDMSDFCIYGGLYRLVNVVYKPRDYIIEDAIYVVDDSIHVDVESATETPIDYSSVLMEIISPRGKIIYSGKAKSVYRVKNPELWDTESPKLYTVILNYNGQRIEKKVGFRSYEFIEHGPFILNGRRVLLRGTHRHEDFAGVGAAVSDESLRKEMKQMKAMGVNFIRLGHYQQSELTLSLCDSLGILVWEEIPWCRGGLGGEKYRSQAHSMLRNMITQHRHHPSVILWGLGNENDWPGDFEEFSKDSIRSMMKELHEEAHHLDNTRMTCIRRCDFCSDIVDVYSPSLWAGWYSKKFTDYKEMETNAISRFPRFFHAEWGGDSHAGRHSETGFDIEKGDANGDWSESYIVRLFDWVLHEQESMEDLTGSAFWTFRDFATPLRPENPIPYVNQKGVTQRDGTPKESYYVFQSYWTNPNAAPMLHIYGHDWPIRWGRAAEEKEVLVYSNLPEVELFLNGASQGKHKRNVSEYPAAGLSWKVKFAEGKNTLTAVAGNLCDEITLQYETRKWGSAANLIVTSQRTIEEGIREFEVQLVDCDGVPCLDSRQWIRFQCVGDAELQSNLGTVTGSSKIQAANGRAKIRLRVNGEAVLAVKVDGIPTALVKIY